MSLKDWLREYREYPIDESRRPTPRPAPRPDIPAEPPPGDEAGAYAILPADRPRDRTPRWLRRAGRTSYAPPRPF
jgi:hypothetical protein